MLVCKRAGDSKRRKKLEKRAKKRKTARVNETEQKRLWKDMMGMTMWKGNVHEVIPHTYLHSVYV